MQKKNKTFGCTRFIYNKMLEDKISYYNETKKMLKCYPSQYKDEYEWLKEVDSQALVGAYNSLNIAYKNFFERQEVGFPKFKTKRRSKKSYTTYLINNNIRIEGNRIKLPKLKWVRVVLHRNIPEGYILKSVTVSQSSAGRYYVSMLYEYYVDIAPVEVILSWSECGNVMGRELNAAIDIKNRIHKLTSIQNVSTETQTRACVNILIRVNSKCDHKSMIGLFV